jgi:hypothetical protein
VAAEMPYTDLAEAVVARIKTRRRVRVSAWTFTSVGLAGALVATIAVSVAAVVDNVDRAIAEYTPTPFAVPTERDEIPDPLPATLTDPIRSAAFDYCGEAEANNPRDPEPCGQWRVTTLTGDAWRLDDVRAGYDEETGGYMPLAVSQDGHRLAYQNSQGRYLVHDLPTGLIKGIDVVDPFREARITSSPSGRYFAIDFGTKVSATLDFETGMTYRSRGDNVGLLAVADDGTRVVTEQKDVDDVPGHASVTTIRVEGANDPATAYRVDPALVVDGGALSPDGRTLALATTDDRLISMDARTGRVTGPRTPLDGDDLGVLKVERWLSADEVLVRTWDYDDVYLTKVNVRTGKTADFGDDVTDWLAEDDPLGAVDN